MSELGNKELSSRVIEAAIAVHTALGPGFIESVYVSALSVELEARGIGFERQKVVRVQHRGIEVGEHRLDLLVEKCLLVELKAVKELEDIFFCHWPVANEGDGYSGWIDPQLLHDASHHQAHRSRTFCFLTS